MFNVHNRSYLTLMEYTPRQIHFLLDLSRDLKRAKYAGNESQRLNGKNIALIFEKTSTRTRCAFEVAAHDQGAHVTYLDSSGSQIGHKESIKDTARVLGRMFDAIEYRGFGQDIVDELAKFAGVPVYNGLTDEFHPTQMLADMLTMHEFSDKPLHDVAYAYVGDAHNNTGNSLMIVGTKLGMDVRLCAPRHLWPHDELVAQCRTIAVTTGARLTLTDQPHEAVKGVDFIYTDVWVSMGDEREQEQRLKVFAPYQVNEQVMSMADRDAIFMHCLPARRDLEVTNEVMDSRQSRIDDQAENRLHAQKALLQKVLGL